MFFATILLKREPVGSENLKGDDVSCSSYFGEKIPERVRIEGGILFEQVEEKDDVFG